VNARFYMLSHTLMSDVPFLAASLLALASLRAAARSERVLSREVGAAGVFLALAGLARAGGGGPAPPGAPYPLPRAGSAGPSFGAPQEGGARHGARRPRPRDLDRAQSRGLRAHDRVREPVPRRRSGGVGVGRDHGDRAPRSDLARLLGVLRDRRRSPVPA